MKVIKQRAEQVYAYGTKVSKTSTIEEVRKILEKFDAVGFNYVEDPIHDEKSIAFFLKTQRFGLMPVRINIPEIYLKSKRNGKPDTYLERESYRALVLLLKSRLTEIELGESIEAVFLLDMVTAGQGTVRDRLLGQNSELPKLLGRG